MSVTLRQRKKGKKISLYLDYYQHGKRAYEYLGLYLKPDNGNLSRLEKSENKRTLELAETIRAKRLLEIQNGRFGMHDRSKLEASFIEYYKQLMEKRQHHESNSNFGNWKSALIHLEAFTGDELTFAEITRQWVENFRDYLVKDARTKGGRRLSQNSTASYYSKVVAAIKHAVKDGILIQNPAQGVEFIKQVDPERQFLTLEELQRLAATDCEIPVLKNAFLFSALTGLRWSDIEKLTWSEVHFSGEYGHFIQFRQKKTKGFETLPISKQASDLLGKRGRPDEQVFKGLAYSAWLNIKLRVWMLSAGISKKISFHCARHTFATLQLSLGTDIYTVSKMLGHRDLKTTQVYAKIIDEKKREAASKIKLQFGAQPLFTENQTLQQ